MELAIKDTYDSLEEKMLKFEQANCPVIHTFGPGIYIREVRMPKGALVLGHHQIFEQMNIFLKGKVLIIEPDGSKSVLSAPMMFTGNPGRKMGYVLEDVVWLNIYPTEERDIEKLETTYFKKSETWESHQDKESKLLDNKDYKQALLEIGTTEKQVRIETENEEDQIDIPFGSYKIGIFKSNIEGRGVFATADIKVGEVIAPARLGGKRTPVGRYTNHSIKPNAKMISVDNDILLVATTIIDGCRGGYMGDEITTNYRDNIKLIGDMPCPE